MTRDLPFDDDSEAADRAGDTAYRVATGVAQVARAGAYVTGGALVAANGGGVPAQPDESRLDSWNTGWAHNTDPDPDQPSPVVTFPDPVVEPTPYAPPTASNSPVVHGQWAPGFTLPSTDPGYVDLPSLPTLDGEYGGTDAGLPLPTLPGGDAGGHGMQLPGFSGGGVPGPGGIPHIPGVGGNHAGLTLSGTQGHVSDGLSLPGPVGSDPSGAVEPGGHGFGLPGHGLGQAGHGFGLPGANGFVAPGSTVFDLPGNIALDATPAAGDPFDGVGAGGDHLGVFVGTQWSIDFGLGPNGVYFTSEMKVDAAAGQVGDQLDQFTDGLADGIHVPDGAGRTATEAQASGQSSPGLGALAAPTAGTPAAQSLAASAAQPVGQPLAASAPIAVVSGPVAPMASVAPAASVAPTASVAPAAPAAFVATPIVATPLQTTIQPDAATTPIANALAAPEGPSVLTAPAAVVPALFDHIVRPVPVLEPAPVTDSPPSGPTSSPTTKPTTIVKTTPTPTLPDDVTTPSVPKTPDQGTIKVPGAGTTTVPHGGVGTGPNVPTTEPPGRTVTKPATPTSGPDDDATTPGGIDAPGTGAGTSHSTRPTHQPTDDAPTNDLPTDDVPTVSVPAHPTVAPTYSAPTHAPSAPTVDIEPHTPVAPTYVPPAQVPVPVKPQVIDPKLHGISAPIGGDHAAGPGLMPLMVADHPIVDHSVLTVDSGGNLSSALMPESTGAEPHHLVSGGLDHLLM
ncbi:hypothetical protein AB0C34_20670 [Nocardia sp. NPDC049220]|uniref:hypothetical protein n=1 Tax=Nocardia sp. NPDC049220 TaxID=3155273 RepID=UPI0033F66DEA